MERRKFISQMGLLGLGFNNFNHIPVKMPGTGRPVNNAEDDDDILILSIKIIKAFPLSCTAKPYIEFPTSNTTWSAVIRKNKYGVQLNKYGELDGENLWEIYFNIKSESGKFKKEAIRVTIPGMEAARVIVGHTDVPFRQTGDVLEFEIIDDRSMGQYMKSEDYQNPLGGYPIGFIHNWDIRKAGKYALEEFPYKKFKAVPNYLLSAQEVLRQMGNMGPGTPKGFNGEISLLGSEAASSRGHMDYPPHVHIMLYEFDEHKRWKSRLAPHFYMDDDGYITRNHYSRIVGSRGSQSGEYGIGDVVDLVDSEGNNALSLTIEEQGGLSLTPPDGRRYSIRPDPKKGPTEAVIGYFNDKMICKAQVHDYPDLGLFRLRLEVFADPGHSRIIQDGYLYDRFTAKQYKKLYND